MAHIMAMSKCGGVSSLFQCFSNPSRSAIYPWFVDLLLWRLAIGLPVVRAEPALAGLQIKGAPSGMARSLRQLASGAATGRAKKGRIAPALFRFGDGWAQLPAPGP